MSLPWKHRVCRTALAGLLLLGSGLAPAADVHLSSSAWPGGLVGVVVAARTLDLAPQVEGRLESLKVGLGDRVKEGQELATLDRQPFEIELAARQAGVKAAEAEQARSQVLLTQAKQTLEREKRVREYTAAEALETAENQYAMALSDVALAQARTAQAQAQRDHAASSLAYTRLRAPFAGVISEVFIYPGAQVGRATPVVRVVSEELRLRVAVPASLAGRVRPGTPLKARLESLELVVTGVVESVSPEIDPASRHLKAEARLEVPEAHRGRVPTGLVAQVELEVESATLGSDGPP